MITEHKTVLITGANQGIGFEAAGALARLGYFVYLGCRDKTRGSDAVKRWNSSGLANIESIEIDVTHIHSIKTARQQLENKIDALDVLINNAAIPGQQPQNMSGGEVTNLREVFETNFFGAVQTTQEFIPLLAKSGKPVIINISSEMGSLSIQSDTKNPNRRLYDAYSCSKTALNAFTVMLAKEFENTRFKILSVAPGFTATNLNQYRGTQTPVEAARVIVKYASEDRDSPSGRFLNKSGVVPW